jgi:hypothetical protein
MFDTHVNPPLRITDGELQGIPQSQKIECNREAEETNPEVIKSVTEILAAKSLHPVSDGNIEP